MKMTDILHRYYGDFDLIKEKWNEDYESILIKTKYDQKYIKMSFGKENTQKRRLLYSLLEKRPREQKYPLYR